MEKIAIIGDTHFARKAENPVIKKKLQEGQYKYFEHLKEYFTQNNIKTILFTGDIHDTRTTINIESLVFTRRLMTKLFKDFDKYIVLGNHDLYYENSYEISLLEMFEDIPNLTIYKNEITIKKLCNKDWHFIPWIIQENEESFKEYLINLSKNSPEIRKNTVLFGHFEMFGVDREGGSLSTTGIDPNLFLNAADLTLSGHYHGKSDIQKSGGLIRYVGSPYPLTFINANTNHGIWLMDDIGNMEFIENTISPRFADIWDTDDIDSMDNLNNSFVRFYIANSNSSEEEFNLRLKMESKKPLLIIPIPYSGEKDELIAKTDIEKEATKIIGMDTYRLAEMYINNNTDSLPVLKSSNDAISEILKQIKHFSLEIK